MADITEKIDEKRQVQEQLKQAAANTENAAKEALAAKPEAKAQEKQAAKAQEKPKKTSDEEPKPKKVVLERFAVVPLIDVYLASRANRARLAVAKLRTYAAKHMKVAPNMVKISMASASAINAGGSRHPPHKLRVILRKLEDGIVTMDLQVPTPTRKQVEAKQRKAAPAAAAPKAAAAKKAVAAKAAPIAAQKK